MLLIVLYGGSCHIFVPGELSLELLFPVVSRWDLKTNEKGFCQLAVRKSFADTVFCCVFACAFVDKCLLSLTKVRVVSFDWTMVGCSK